MTLELVSDAIDALVELWKERTDFGDVGTPQILDGAEVNYIAGLYVVVGLAGGDDIVEAESERAGMGSRRTDRANVPCAVWAAGGDTDMRAHRQRAFALFHAARAAVADDFRLAGAVTRAEITTYRYEPRRNQRGAGAGVLFEVDVVRL